jgi:signal transduction histidine kinase/ABC-type amino acid transport substrate-binding protein
MIRKIILLTCLTVLCSILPTEAQWAREYTEDHPLVIVSDWEFPPYEFRNDNGEPDGYNVEVLDLILNNLKVPHRYMMQEWFQCTRSFENHEADLIHALANNYSKHPYVMTQNMITYYPVKVVRRKSQTPLQSISELKEDDTLMVKDNDYVALRIKAIQNKPFHTEYHTPREALSAIRNGHRAYFIWGGTPLKMKIKEYGLDSLLLDDIDIPAGELRIIGYDKELIDAIDDAYARLEQSGELQPIHDKWFNPERVHNDSSPIALFALIGSVIAIIITLLLSRLIRARIRAATNRSEDINGMMKQALQMGNFYIFEYNIRTDHMRNIHGQLIPEEELTLEAFTSRFEPADQQDFIHHTQSLIAGKEQSRYFNRLFNIGTGESPDWRHLEGTAIFEKEKGKPCFIVYAVKDITLDVEAERINQEMSNKYIRMFETNLIAMSFYDKDGWLVEANEKMAQLCGFDDKGYEFFKNTNMFETAMLINVYEHGSREPLHVCSHMYYPEVNLDKYIEIRIRPILDEQGELYFYVITSRDITAERTMYLEKIHHDIEIRKTSEAINIYEHQLAYLLENSEMVVWRSDLKTRTLTYSRSLRNPDYQESMDDYVKRIFPNEGQDAMRAMRDPVAMNKPFNVIHHFRYTHYNKKPSWHAVSGITTFDKYGNRIGYFGVSRDITKLIVAQQKLKKETARAEDSGKMKSAFLANMTHEIRTPLNAIVGFSDLLPMVDTSEERMEFIRIIRNNCDMLMRLINDILEASNMGQALAIKPEEVDIATAFDDICQTLAQRVQEPGVEFIKDNPYEHYVTTLDKGRVQQILTNFVTNAVKYTHNGFIKVGYHYDRRMTLDEQGEADGLVFYCLDTGAGIPKEKQASVFERFVKLNDFVQGTGLGLSICQAIAERCNGHIGVTSEGEGHGSSFWVWIPCERKEK